jgi:O-antigen/teichoic acid export membrane protein
MIIQVPILFAVIFLSNQIIYLLAGKDYTLAPLLLRLSLIGPLISTASGSGVLGSLILFMRIYKDYSKNKSYRRRYKLSFIDNIFTNFRLLWIFPYWMD